MDKEAIKETLLAKYRAKWRAKMRPKGYKKRVVVPEACLPVGTESKLLLGDCLEVLKTFPDNTFTAVVTDPPYGLSSAPDMREVLRHWLRGDDYAHRGAGFMGKEWDSFVPGPKTWAEIMRVLRPGGHILSFAGTRTYDLMTMAIRLAGAEVRDKMDFYCEMTDYRAWAYGSGFPKSLNIGKAIDKAAGVEREVLSERPAYGLGDGRSMAGHTEGAVARVTAPATEAAKDWEGHGTALKPAHEPVSVFTKGEGEPLPEGVPFLYTPKAAKKERNMGCDDLFWEQVDQEVVAIEKAQYDEIQAENKARKDEEGFSPRTVMAGNIHPTVKPIELARYLVKLVEMPNGNLILDPFMGSGTTPCACLLEGFGYVGIDSDPVSLRIAEARTEHIKAGRMEL